MSDLDLLHFEQLKSQIQAKHLETHTPSNEDISQWKGIDIVYFQEDLRQKVKGNISEKSFYTYFKSSPATKLPRIDILNLLANYAGYPSWFDFKKKHPFTNEILEESLDSDTLLADLEDSLEKVAAPSKEEYPTSVTTTENKDPHPSIEILSPTTPINPPTIRPRLEQAEIDKPKSPITRKPSKYYWVGGMGLTAIAILVFVFWDSLFTKEYYYNFIDSDRNSKIAADLQVQILKENESPILYTAKPNEPFVYRNPEGSTLTMVVSSPYYRTDTIRRNLKTAPESENIELKPNDYAIMLYYYSNSLQDIKRTRENLNVLISNDALIYQVYDNDTYGIETLDKSRYINLVTTPTTSLKNMEVIDSKMENGKIVLIKFRISTHEES